MPRDMFGDVVQSSINLGSRKWYTLPVSILVHAALVAAVVIIPLMAADSLPTPPTILAFVGAPAAPPPPPPPPPPPSSTPPQAAAAKPVIDVNPAPAAAPVEAQPEIKPESATVKPESTIKNVGIEGGIPGGVTGGIVGGLLEAPPPPPLPPAPVRVGGVIRAPVRIRNVNPVYPPIAQSARVQGIVILEATIGQNGKVEDVKVLRSIPLLDAAALDAVRQWEYTPTLLNGVPVPVVMTVTVNFTLQ